MIITASVKTSQPQESVTEENGIYKISLKSKPIQGRANEELVKILEKHFRMKVKKICGKASHKKTIELE